MQKNTKQCVWLYLLFISLIFLHTATAQNYIKNAEEINQFKKSYPKIVENNTLESTRIIQAEEKVAEKNIVAKKNLDTQNDLRWNIQAGIYSADIDLFLNRSIFVAGEYFINRMFAVFTELDLRSIGKLEDQKKIITRSENKLGFSAGINTKVLSLFNEDLFNLYVSTGFTTYSTFEKSDINLALFAGPEIRIKINKKLSLVSRYRMAFQHDNLFGLGFSYGF